MPYLFTLLKGFWNDLECAGEEEGLPGREIIGVLAVIVGEFPPGGAGSGVVGSVGKDGNGSRASTRLVAREGGAEVREVVEEGGGGESETSGDEDRCFGVKGESQCHVGG
jgi:hypothetical protein